MAETAGSALAVLFLYSFLMFTLPFVVFYGAKDLAEKYTSYDKYGVVIISVISSVVTVNVIIIFYVCRAIESAKLDYHEDRLEKMD